MLCNTSSISQHILTEATTKCALNFNKREVASLERDLPWEEPEHSHLYRPTRDRSKRTWRSLATSPKHTSSYLIIGTCHEDRLESCSNKSAKSPQKLLIPPDASCNFACNACGILQANTPKSPRRFRLCGREFEAMHRAAMLMSCRIDSAFS